CGWARSEDGEPSSSDDAASGPSSRRTVGHFPQPSCRRSTTNPAPARDSLRHPPFKRQRALVSFSSRLTNRAPSRWKNATSPRYDYASKIAPPGDAPPAADRPRIPAATLRFRETRRCRPATARIGRDNQRLWLATVPSPRCFPRNSIDVRTPRRRLGGGARASNRRARSRNRDVLHIGRQYRRETAVEDLVSRWLVLGRAARPGRTRHLRKARFEL